MLYLVQRFLFLPALGKPPDHIPYSLMAARLAAQFSLDFSTIISVEVSTSAKAEDSQSHLRGECQEGQKGEEDVKDPNEVGQNTNESARDQTNQAEGDSIRRLLSHYTFHSKG